MSFLLSYLWGPTVALICLLIAGCAVSGAIHRYLERNK